jgi:hypothetical protein
MTHIPSSLKAKRHSSVAQSIVSNSVFQTTPNSPLPLRSQHHLPTRQPLPWEK